VKTRTTKEATDNSMRILSVGKIASAVLAVVGAGSAEDFDDIDDRPASLDLRVQKKVVSQANPPPTRKTNFLPEDKIASAVLAVVGIEPDEYHDLDDHPGNLDLTVGE